MVICKNCSGKKASYGYKKGGEKKFCNICANDIPNLINLDRKMCLDNDCCSEPNYNLSTEKTGIYCTKHKKIDMVDVKHIKCNYEDENKNKCLSLPLVFIRFNPDSYYNKKNEFIKSCWSLSKERIAIINKTKKDEWKNRLLKLKNKIQYYIENEPNKEVEIVNLYYDGFE